MYVCVCVVAFPVPVDPAQRGGAAGVEMLWKLVAVILPTVCLCVLVMKRGFPPPPPLPWMVIWLRRL